MENSWNASTQFRNESHINLVRGCVIVNSVGVPSFSINDAKLYDLVVTLSTEDNAKLLKNGFGT